MLQSTPDLGFVIAGFLVSAVVGFVGCDKAPEARPAPPAAIRAPFIDSGTPPPIPAEAAAASIPDFSYKSIAKAPVQEIEERPLEIGRIVVLRIAPPQYTDLIEADEGQELCLERTFRAESRIFVSNVKDCRRPERPLSLVDTNSGQNLGTFEGFIEHSPELGAVSVRHGRGQHLVRLADGRVHEIDGASADDRYFFVQGRPEILVLGYEPPVGSERRYLAALVEGLPLARPRLEIRPLQHPSRPITYDPERNVRLFRSRNCARASLRGDGQETTCEVRLPAEFGNGSQEFMDDRWFLPRPQRGQPQAFEIVANEYFYPAEGLCEDARPSLRHASTRPRMGFTCPSSAKNDPGALYLWAPPDQRFRLPPGRLGAWRAYGDLFEYGAGAKPSSKGALLLDLDQFVVWKAKDLHLAGTRLLVDRPTLKGTGFAGFYLLDDKHVAHPLGEIECDGEVRVVYQDDEVISVACGADREQTPRCGTQPRITDTVTWDLAHKTVIRGPHRVVGVTRESLITSDSPYLGTAEKPCPGTKLMTVRRKAR